MEKLIFFDYRVDHIMLVMTIVTFLETLNLVFGV